jgi:hypothetical protein
MSDAEGGGDDRVSDSDQISLTRDPGLPQELLDGPFQYMKSEQEMWRALGMAALRKDNQDPTMVIAKIIAVAETSDDELTLEMESDDLIIEGGELAADVRMGIVDGEPFVETDDSS